MVTTELKGRIGNQLFQYVVCRVMSIKLNTGYGYWGWDWTGGSFFNLPKINKSKSPSLFKEGINKFNEELFHITDNTHIDGYWQSEKYFYGYEDKIREWFHIEDIDIGDDQCVIHFRAQDGYLSDNYVLPVTYFEQAKEIIKKENPNVSFMVVTDNVNMAKKYFKGDTIVSNDMKKDFRLIKSAKYKIISNSSFSWWAAWLNLPTSSMVIAPNRWMNYNYNKFKEEKFYPYDVKTSGFIYI